MIWVLHYQARFWCPEPTTFAAAETTLVSKWAQPTNQLPLPYFKRRAVPGFSEGPRFPELYAVSVDKWAQPTNQRPLRGRRPLPRTQYDITPYPVIPDVPTLGHWQQPPQVPPARRKQWHVGTFSFAPPAQETYQPPVDRWFTQPVSEPALRRRQRYHVTGGAFGHVEQSLYQTPHVSSFWFQYGDAPRKIKNLPTLGTSVFYPQPQTDVVVNPLSAVDADTFRRTTDDDQSIRSVQVSEDTYSRTPGDDDVYRRT